MGILILWLGQWVHLLDAAESWLRKDTCNTISHWKLLFDFKTFVDPIDPYLLTDGTRIYNADEREFAFDPRARSVVTFQGVKYVYKLKANTKIQELLIKIAA